MKGEFMIIPSEWIIPLTSFLFVFAVVYALLIESKVIKLKNACAIIAAVFGVFASMYQPFVSVLQSIMPIATIVLIIVFILIFIKKLVGGKREDKDMLPTVVVLAALLMIIGIFWDKISPYVPYQFGAENLLWIVGIIVVIGILYAVYKHEPEAPPQPRIGK